MSSINTNLSAITALQSLKATQNAMNKNQNQISTGLRVGEASHNASYWSISTKMKSDNGALGAVKDSIKQSKAMIDTYTSALDKSLKFLDTMKTKLTAGSNPGADKNAIQVELKASIEGLKSAARSAVFNGQNWLTGDPQNVKLVTSFDATAGKVNTLDINTTGIQLFDDPDNIAAGLLEDVAGIDISATGNQASVAFDLTGFAATDTVAFELGSYGTQTFTIGSQSTVSDVAKSINENASLNALVNASVNDDGQLVLTSKVDAEDFVAGGTAYTVVAGSGITDAGAIDPYAAGGGDSVADALKFVHDAIDALTKGSAMLGANKALLETQEEFIGVLSDSLTAGVSAFIDADMNEASTRNQALQTQQQLGVQALSMANQNSQMILKLFQ